MRKKDKFIRGVGVNDVDYPVYSTVNGKKVSLPEYVVWKNMLGRCYDQKYQNKYPTYIGCEVAPEWHSLSNFTNWFHTNDWQDKQLDKDILIPGNKIYSPSTCVFISPQLNSFLLDRGNAKGGCLIGCVWDKRENKYLAQCSNPFTKKRVHLGYFKDELLAHNAWREYKHKLALIYAEQQTDPRIAKALRERFKPY